MPDRPPAIAVQIRKASPEDAAGIATVLEQVTAERVHSAIVRPWTAGEERRYLASLSPREAVHVAVDRAGLIVGYQSLDLWSSILDSMAHVGQVGTFVSAASRGQGVGLRLWDSTRRFAISAGYRKLVITVRASNSAAQAFYGRLGFRECGRLARQVLIDGIEEDEILMEHFLVTI